MNRNLALRTADLWRIGTRTQVRGYDVIEDHETISAAKRFSRKQGRCVVPRKEELGSGGQQFGFFRYAPE